MASSKVGVFVKNCVCSFLVEILFLRNSIQTSSTNGVGISSALFPKSHQM